ncbi:hypothetical protein AMATHDRAFT_1249 [Amanita thiersii Skay4041]|uniref:Uncharacterized protein n=1 Tax=Amanita thiersii Skay4041 TaxID=703135 RepID=A0A2A9NZP2_9AGAR|nr:hypothetical protein AMATHDRAFT_1249 [Amanita thiersii Skay4041]
MAISATTIITSPSTGDTLEETKMASSIEYLAHILQIRVETLRQVAEHMQDAGSHNNSEDICAQTGSINPLVADLSQAVSGPTVPQPHNRRLKNKRAPRQTRISARRKITHTTMAADVLPISSTSAYIHNYMSSSQEFGRHESHNIAMPDTETPMDGLTESSALGRLGQFRARLFTAVQDLTFAKTLLGQRMKKTAGIIKTGAKYFGIARTNDFLQDFASNKSKSRRQCSTRTTSYAWRTTEEVLSAILPDDEDCSNYISTHQDTISSDSNASRILKESLVTRESCLDRSDIDVHENTLTCPAEYTKEILPGNAKPSGLIAPISSSRKRRRDEDNESEAEVEASIVSDQLPITSSVKRLRLLGPSASGSTSDVQPGREKSTNTDIPVTYVHLADEQSVSEEEESDRWEAEEVSERLLGQSLDSSVEGEKSELNLLQDHQPPSTQISDRSTIDFTVSIIGKSTPCATRSARRYHPYQLGRQLSSPSPPSRQTTARRSGPPLSPPPPPAVIPKGEPHSDEHEDALRLPSVKPAPQQLDPAAVPVSSRVKDPPAEDLPQSNFLPGGTKREIPERRRLDFAHEIMLGSRSNGNGYKLYDLTKRPGWEDCDLKYKRAREAGEAARLAEFEKAQKEQVIKPDGVEVKREPDIKTEQQQIRIPQRVLRKRIKN